VGSINSYGISWIEICQSVHFPKRRAEFSSTFDGSLHNDFEGLHGSVLHHTPLPSVDSVVGELLADETRLKSQSNLHSEKGILSNPTSIFAAPFHKSNLQGRAVIVIDKCGFCKEKGE
jgi:hypothetical protein